MLRERGCTPSEQRPVEIEQLGTVLKRTPGINVSYDGQYTEGSRGSVLECSVVGRHLNCPALPELVILAVHDYKMRSARMDLGWGYRDHFSCAPHPIHVFPPDNQFSWILDGPGRATFLTIDANSTFQTFDELGVSDPLDGLWMLSQGGFPQPHLYATIVALSGQLQNGECPRLLIDSYMVTIIFGLSMQWRATSQRASQTGRLSKAVLSNAIAFINERMSEDLSLEDMARLSGMTKYHFLRRFKASMGSSPYQYLRDRRIERARNLLSTTHYPIRDIAERCGFASATGFSSVFRKIVGVAPSEWRALQRK